MRLEARARQIVDEFRAGIEGAVAAELTLTAPEHHDRRDASTLATRWKAGHRVWYEMAVRPFIPQVRVGLLTDDRDRNQDFEEMIDATTLTTQEFVAQGLAAAGLAWPDPPVEHYCERTSEFYFATPLDLTSIDVLADEAFRDRALRILLGYHHAFSGGIV